MSTRGANEVEFTSGGYSSFNNEGAQSPRKKFSEDELTELSLNNKVSQNNENPKQGLLVIWENWRCLKNLCRFWRFEVPAESELLDDGEDDAGAELDEEEGEASPWERVLLVIRAGNVILSCFLTLSVQLSQVAAISSVSGHGSLSKGNAPSVTWALKIAPLPVRELAAPSAPTMLDMELAAIPWMLTSLKAGLKLFLKLGNFSRIKDWVSCPNKRVIGPPDWNIFFAS